MSRPVFEHRIIAPADAIDELGHVNNAVWVQWIQEVALAHWYSVADPQHQDDYIWVVVRHEIDYLRAAFEGEVLTGRTWVGESPKGARFDRHMEFAGEDGKVRVHGEIWNATSTEPIAPNRRVTVQAVEGLALRVREEGK